MAFISQPGIVTTCFLTRKVAHFTARHRTDLIQICNDLLPAKVVEFTAFLDGLQTALVIVVDLCDLWLDSRHSCRDKSGRVLAIRNESGRASSQKTVQYFNA